MSTDHEVAVLGRGHAPVGQVGPQLRRVRHGRRPRRAGRRRRHVGRRRVRRRRRHHPQRLPGLHRRCHLQPGARLEGQPGGQLLRGLRLGGPGPQHRPGPDPGRLLRGRARRRRRHHAEGLLRPGRRRSARRPRLAALPPARRHQPHLLRPLRTTPHGALRRHQGRLRPGAGQEQPPRRHQPERPLPQGVQRGRRAGLARRGRSADAARDLRHLRRGRRHRAHEHGRSPRPAPPTR